MPPRHSLLVVSNRTLPLLVNLHLSFFITDSPEVLAGSVIGGSAVSTSVAKGTATVAKASTSKAAAGAATSVSAPGGSSSKSSSSNTAAIAGGVAGGVVGLALIGGILFYFLRRRQQPPQAPSAAFMVDGAMPSDSTSHMMQVPPPQPEDQGTMSSYVPGTPGSPMKLYVRVLLQPAHLSFVSDIFAQDPNDPTTYPGFQSAPTTPDPPVSTTMSYDGSLNANNNLNGLNGNTLNGNTANAHPLNGNTLASMQTTRPQVQGYHGLPTV